MIFKHQRGSSSDELVLTVKNKIVTLVNPRKNAFRTKDLSTFETDCPDELRRSKKYEAHVNEMVTNQMLEIIGAILAVSDQDAESKRSSVTLQVDIEEVDQVS